MSGTRDERPRMSPLFPCTFPPAQDEYTKMILRFRRKTTMYDMLVKLYELPEDAALAAPND